MHNDVWIREGTISWPRRSGRESTVLPAGSAFLAMYDPEKAVKRYGRDPDFMDYVSVFLSETIGYGVEKELLENFNVEFSPKIRNKRELKANVSSLYEKDVEYVVNLNNLRWPLPPLRMLPREEVLLSVKALEIYDGSCTCPRLTSVGECRSMPFDYCSHWFNMSAGEYQRILADSNEEKPYGKIMCKHQAKALVEDGRYGPVFNEELFYLQLDNMLSALSDAPKEHGKLKAEEMDKVIKPHIMEMGFDVVIEYFKKKRQMDATIESMEEKIVRKLGRPKITHF